MSRERMLLIVAGTGLIVLVVAIAAFSLGVYVGVHGWGAGAPPVARPAQPAVAPAAGRPAQDAPPAGPRPGAAAPAVEQRPEDGQPSGAQQPIERPGTAPQLVGRVRSRSEDTITLNTADGPRLFQLGPDVQVAEVVEGVGEVAASLEQVQPGRGLAVFGHFVADGPRRLVAHRLLLLPQPQSPP